MQTIHLTREQIHGYLVDFAQRLGQFGADSPQVWAVIGSSGSVVAKHLGEIAPSLYNAAEELIVAYDRSSDVVSFPKEENPNSVVKGKRVLLVDSTVLSGGTLTRIVKELQKLGPAGLTSYALAVQRGSKIIPNHFGFLIGDHDRVHFPTSQLANNCLGEYGVYRKLSEEDGRREMIKSGKEFIDKISWDDRLYEIGTDSRRHVYVHEQNGAICGFISFRFSDKRTILVDELATDLAYRKRSLGGHLMRWVEHYARHKNCAQIELWAVDDRVAFYEHFGYESLAKGSLTLSGEKFWRMSKKLLYNLADDDTLVMGG